ncbi:hypothetical protein [Streptomyces inhibens]|nr:hypothetical protein [Streptomyces inhibens]
MPLPWTAEPRQQRGFVGRDFYAKVLHGTQTRANALIEQELDG